MANTHIISADVQNLTGAYSLSRVFKSPLTEFYTSPYVGLTSDKAYFVFVGKTNQVCAPQYVEFIVGTAGAGAQTAEVGLFSTASGPTRNTALTMNKIVATGTIGDLTTTGATLRNTAAFATSVAAGTYLWAGIRTAMAATQPYLSALFWEWGDGFVLSCAGAGALTAAGPWTGSIIAYASPPVTPMLKVTLD